MLLRLCALIAATWQIAPPVEASTGEFSQPVPMASRPADHDRAVTRIAFGSCYAPQLERPGIWTSIAHSEPQLMLLLGDNVYQSEELAQPGLRELREAYAMLAAEPEFAALRERTTVLATWDDHDYGLNDAGAEFPQRAESEALFEAVWPLPKGASRAAGRGIYTHMTLGPPGRRLQVLMLDTRSFRDAWPDRSSGSASQATLLGASQWSWLQARLQEPADLRLLVSSIPVLSDRDSGENWARMPNERVRLLKLLEGRAGGDLLILSGDTHYAAMLTSKGESGDGLLEATSSSLTLPISENRRDSLDLEDAARIGEVRFEENYGLLEIDWEARLMTVKLLDREGKPLLHRPVPLTSQAPPTPDLQ